MSCALGLAVSVTSARRSTRTPGPDRFRAQRRDDHARADRNVAQRPVQALLVSRDAHAVTSVMRVLQARARDRIELAGDDTGGDRCE